VLIFRLLLTGALLINGGIFVNRFSLYVTYLLFAMYSKLQRGDETNAYTLATAAKYANLDIISYQNRLTNIAI
jgi:hypothetical protein